MTKKRLFSGMQPTGGGRLHLGNLEGALRPWVARQDEYEMFCFIADWHSLTTVAEKRMDIAEAARQTAIDFLAAGLTRPSARSSASRMCRNMPNCICCYRW